MKNLAFILFFLMGLATALSAQTATQTLRGVILDRQSEEPLVGVSVVVVGSQPVLSAETDENGRYRIEAVPIGRIELSVLLMGYEPLNVPNVMLTSGKEVVLDLGLEESIIALEAAVVTADAEKDKAQNGMATISARTFGMEEVNRYAGGLGDPSRLVRNFAGVSGTDDSRNDIVIRGNSPTGVQWRLEGATIPNPNHFSTLGTTGGPVSMLNINLLRSSDFLTSAFPSEYGNVTGGVFDLGLRSGNNERFEFTGQIGFNGFEAMAEGPMSRNKNSSFLASYRYSVFGVVGNIVDIGTNAVPDYQDFTFKLNFGNGKAGKFSLFGMGGISDIAFLGRDLAADDVYSNRNEDLYAHSRLGVVGLNHSISVGENAYWRTSLSASYSESAFETDSLFGDVDKIRYAEGTDATTTYQLNSFFHKKFNARFTLRSGVTITAYRLNLLNRDLENGLWRNLRDFNGGLELYQAFSQAQYKLTENLTVNTGLHLIGLPSNGSFAAEPRFALNWQAAPRHAFNVGYGLHHQMQSLPVYFERGFVGNGRVIESNKDLGFTRSHHVVLGYDYRPAQDWRIKTEAYVQFLDRVPVDPTEGTYSVSNIGADFVFDVPDSLVNEGLARNYGLELTVEKFFGKGYYGLFTASVFNSEYQAADKTWRNTAFNNQYVLNMLGGKEFKVGKNRNNAITLDGKVSYAGGRYYTPVDLAASLAAGQQVLDNTRAFAERQKDYFRLDLKAGFTLNGPKGRIVQRFSVDFQNLLGTKNVFSQRFDATTGNVVTTYQRGFFPDVLYRVQF